MQQRGGHVEIAKLYSPMVVTLLHGHSADINAQSANGRTPLYSAPLRGHVEIAKLLLTHGADIYTKSMYDGRLLCIVPQRRTRWRLQSNSSAMDRT